MRIDINFGEEKESKRKFQAKLGKRIKARSWKDYILPGNLLDCCDCPFSKMVGDDWNFYKCKVDDHDIYFDDDTTCIFKWVPAHLVAKEEIKTLKEEFENE